MKRYLAVAVLITYMIYGRATAGWDGIGNHLPSPRGGTVTYGLTDLDGFSLQAKNREGLWAASKTVYNAGRISYATLNYPKPSTLTAGTLNNFSALFFVRYAESSMWGNTSYGNYNPQVPPDRLNKSKLTIWVPAETATMTWTERQFDLFKYFSFKGLNGDFLSGSEEKLIVVIHGWNPRGDKNPTAVGDFKTMVNNLRGQIKGTSWKIVPYNWGPDAATGGRLPDNCGQLGNKNGSQAAEIAHQHGQHLGYVLNWKCPQLKKVHFIAHSAGAWAARAAMLYLLAKNSEVEIQLTLLDPFMPSHADDDSSLSPSEFEGLDRNDRIWKMENYYCYDFTDLLYDNCTSQTFGWIGDQHVEQQLPYNKLTTINPTLAQLWNGHSWPVKKYADSIKKPTKMTTGGWRESMFYAEKWVSFIGTWDLHFKWSTSSSWGSTTWVLNGDGTFWIGDYSGGGTWRNDNSQMVLTYSGGTTYTGQLKAPANTYMSGTMRSPNGGRGQWYANWRNATTVKSIGKAAEKAATNSAGL